MKILRLSNKLRSQCSFLAVANSTAIGPGPINPKCILRIGDRAAARGIIYRFRHNNPQAYIIYIESRLPIVFDGAIDIKAEWLLGDIIDELWILETEQDIPLLPEDTKHILNHCFWFENKVVHETLEVPHPHLPKIKISIPLPDKYICLHPVFDRPYDISRNFPLLWWYALGEELGAIMPVVVVGEWLEQASWPSFFINATNLPVMECFHIIKGAHALVGGNSGPTHWSALLGTPTFAIYSDTHMYPMSTDPLPPGFDADYSPRHKTTPVLTVAYHPSTSSIARQFKEFLRSI